MALSRDESTATLRALPVLFTYISGLAKSTDAGLQDIAVQEYSTLLNGRPSREQFWNQRSETIAPLIKILHSAAGIANSGTASATLWSGSTNGRTAGAEGSVGGGVGLQLLYHVLLVMWQMSFEADDVGDELNKYATPRFAHPSYSYLHILASTILFSCIHTSCDCRPKKRQADSFSRHCTTC